MIKIKILYFIVTVKYFYLKTNLVQNIFGL